MRAGMVVQSSMHTFDSAATIDELFFVWYRKGLSKDNYKVKWVCGDRKIKCKILSIIACATEYATADKLLALLRPEPGPASAEWQEWKDGNRDASIQVRDAVVASIGDNIKVQSFSISAISARIGANVKGPIKGDKGDDM
jgi:hypothetical protein